MEGRTGGLDLRQRDTDLALILPAAVAVRRLADIVRRGLEEDHLRDAFVRVNFRRQWRGIREFERHVTLPLRFERRHVHDDPATRVRTLAKADGKHVPGDAEVLDRASERERV